MLLLGRHTDGADTVASAAGEDSGAASEGGVLAGVNRDRVIHEDSIRLILTFTTAETSVDDENTALAEHADEEFVLLFVGFEGGGVSGEGGILPSVVLGSFGVDEGGVGGASKDDRGTVGFTRTHFFGGLILKYIEIFVCLK